MSLDRTIVARELRRGMSTIERRVWYRLKGRQMAGFKFRRRHAIGPYFADLVCLSGRLVIEIDGPTHEARPHHDARRESYLNERGFQVLHFDAAQVDQDMESVMDTILAALVDIPSPRSGEVARRAGEDVQSAASRPLNKQG